MSRTRGVHRLKIQEIRDLGLGDLEKKLSESYRELFNLRFRLATRQLLNYHEISNTRKKIAQIKTIIREKELSIEE
jgi:large subunit ribosomal protein L29